ncbi:MAG: transposase [Muribaculaceae bacterium]|nr:transposase [Muribaculaceae bacterium]
MDDNRNKQRRQWWKRNAGKYQKKPSMTRRKAGHDYRGHFVYMITVVVADRRNVLGMLCDPDENHSMAWVKATPLGKAVKRHWHEIPSHHPHVKLFRSQLMPDHFHGILHVTKKTEVHLTTIIKGFKMACNISAREMGVAQYLWESGYNDLILTSRDQLHHMMNYVLDNPRRLWIKRNHSDFFKVRKTVEAGGQQVEALGNQFLLDFPLIAAVQCTRKLTKKQIQEQVEHFLEMAQSGVVLVSPAISPGEKEVMKAAQEAHCKVIKIVDNGFTPLSKPSGEDFDACARGDLLLISPFEYKNQKPNLTEQICYHLNALAAAIATIK